MDNMLMRRESLQGLPPISALPPGYALRLFRDEDLDALATLLIAAFPEEDWSPEQVRKRLTEEPSVKTVFVVEHAGRIVATASSRLDPDRFPGSGYVHWVASDPAHRGRKLGYAVTLATLHDFVRLDCRDAVLETQDFRLPAIRTYLNLGFLPVCADDAQRERWTRIEAALAARAL